MRNVSILGIMALVVLAPGLVRADHPLSEDRWRCADEVMDAPRQSLIHRLGAAPEQARAIRRHARQWHARERHLNSRLEEARQRAHWGHYRGGPYTYSYGARDGAHEVAALERTLDAERRRARLRVAALLSPAQVRAALDACARGEMTLPVTEDPYLYGTHRPYDHGFRAPPPSYEAPPPPAYVPRTVPRSRYSVQGIWPWGGVELSWRR